MYNLGNNFKLNKENALAKEKYIFKGPKYRITVLSESLVRIEYSETSKFVDTFTPLVKNRVFPDPVFIKKEDENTLSIQTKYFILTYLKNMPFNVKSLSVKILKNEYMWYYGMKEYKNFLGSTNSIDDGLSMPSLKKGLYSPDGFVTIDDSNTILMDENYNVYEKKDNSIDLYLFTYGDDFGKCLNDYFTLTEYPPLIPRYALGNWWTKENEKDSEFLMEILDKFKYNDIPLSVVLLDSGWSKNNLAKFPNIVDGFSFNKNIYKEPQKLISEIHARKIKFGLKINPYYGFYNFEDNYEIATKYTNPNRQGFIDFNPYNAKDADLFLKLFIHPLRNMGVDLFWNDYNCKDNDKIYLSNLYLYRDSLLNSNRGIILGRNSTIAGHTMPLLYSGRLTTSWNVLKILPMFNSTSSNIGISSWSHDVSGSMGGIEEDDLYIRSIQFSVFSPILRISCLKGKYYKKEPWKWDMVTNDIATLYLRLRHRLIPYIYTEYYKYHKEGKCFIKPLYYTNSSLYDDPNYVNQYTFGDSFMISPIINETDPIINRTIQKFYMPEGVWYDFSNGKRFVGNHKYISFYKKEDYPIFVKAGSIIPLAGENSLNSTDNPTELDIHIFPGCNNSYRLYEDDGSTFNYKNGSYLITEIDYNYRASNYTVIIRGVEGDKNVIPNTRTYRIVFRNTKKADNVVVYENNTPIKYETEVSETDFTVIVKDFNTHNQLVVNCYGKDIETDALMLIKDDVESILYDLKIDTKLKDSIAEIIFSDKSLSKKRIGLKKLKKSGLDPRNIKVFLKLIEYMDM